MSDQTSQNQAVGETTVGSYFVSNYPPYSYWSRDYVEQAREALDRPPAPGADLGIYVHIPFCRKRCRFCYFKVYTDQDSSAIARYLDALITELELYKGKPFLGGRKPSFIYFGGGTPSFLSTTQLSRLVEKMQEVFAWNEAREIAFECEPGTITEHKLNILHDMGVTRLSLGVENFTQDILEVNGRAHGAPEIDRAFSLARKVGFPQINVDLIAGMIGETDENWAACVERAAAMEPDNITIYQMELPHNTIISREMKELGVASPVADWPTKRRWVNEAFDYLLGRGYRISSGNELVRSLDTDHFVYRDNVWRGCDLLAVGVSSFGHFQGVHYQNLDAIEEYIDAVNRGELPINRAMTPTAHQLLIREFVLQLKEGRLAIEPFRRKFGVDVREEFAEPLRNQHAAGYLEVEDDQIVLTRKGLLQVDTLLPEYFEKEHRSVRYT